jgi:uncharacterized cupredoxin-like copper-binding protein
MLVLAALFAVGTGCAESDGRSGSTATARETASASADTIDIAMNDFAYEPDTLTIPAGTPVTLAFTNTGSVEHYFVVGDTMTADADGFEHSLFDGVSIEKNKQTEDHDEEEEAHEEGEEHHPNEFELPPGGQGTMTFTLPPEKAGTYTIACFETTGGQMHHELGMNGALRVTAPGN